jgi:transaldolase
MNSVNRAVFLDRDGVINRPSVRDGKPHPPTTLEEFELLPGVEKTIRALRVAGYLVIVVTNQPDVATGVQRRDVVEAMHEKLRAAGLCDDIKACYHTDADGCGCRKPKPGMLIEAARERQIDLARSFMVGDRWRDVAAGRAAGCRTFFIDNGYRERRADDPDAVVASLEEAGRLILQEQLSTRGGRTMSATENLKIKLFADGADLAGMKEMYANPMIKGFTTNPTLMRKAGVQDYKAFAREVLEAIPDRPISFEVFADEFDEMERQALEIASWGESVNVKIPVTNTQKQFSGPLIERLSEAGVALNVTAVTSLDQVRIVTERLAPNTPAIISVFAGRIADTGRDPVPLMAEAVRIMRAKPKAELIWASPRELLNIFQADSVGCHIITATNDILKKLSLVGKDLEHYSLETVQMFHRDAQAAGYRIMVTA